MTSESPWKRILRGVLAVLMIGVGISHFVDPAPFVAIVPSWLPGPLALVYLSGVFEVLGGLGLLVPRTQRAAAFGLIALFVAVFPANVNQALNQVSFDDGPPPPSWALYGRLPFQLLFIAWAFWLSRPAPPASALPSQSN